MKQGIRYYRDGLEIDEHEALSNGVLREGVTLSVPTSMRDSVRPRAIANKSHPLVVDGFGNPAGHRPGYAFTPKNQSASDAKWRAYEAYDANVSNLWRDPQGDDGDEQLGSGTQKHRTLQPRGENLRDPIGDAIREHRKRMESVYRKHDTRVSNAWRGG